MLPPLEWYVGQAQVLANTFMRQHPMPRFARWSELFDISSLKEHIPVVEWHDFVAAQESVDGSRLMIDAAVLDIPGPTPIQPTSSVVEHPALTEERCPRSSSRGLLANLSKMGSLREGLPAQHYYGGELWEEQTIIRQLRCGSLLLRPGATSLGPWFDSARVAAAFGVGRPGGSAILASHAQDRDVVEWMPPSRYALLTMFRGPAVLATANGSELENCVSSADG